MAVEKKYSHIKLITELKIESQDYLNYFRNDEITCLTLLLVKYKFTSSDNLYKHSFITDYIKLKA